MSFRASLLKPNFGIELEPFVPCVDLAWAAGFFDGDGCIAIARQRHKDYETITHRLKVIVTQNNLEVLKELQVILNENGFITHAPRIQTANRQSYSLGFDGRHGLNVIRKLRPYLRRKSLEASAVLAMWEQGSMGRHPGRKGWPPEVYKIREQWAQKISKLK